MAIDILGPMTPTTSTPWRCMGEVHISHGARFPSEWSCALVLLLRQARLGVLLIGLPISGVVSDVVFRGRWHSFGVPVRRNTSPQQCHHRYHPRHRCCVRRLHSQYSPLHPADVYYLGPQGIPSLCNWQGGGPLQSARK